MVLYLVLFLLVGSAFAEEKPPVLLNVQIISPTPNTPEIHFAGDRMLVGLKNSDPLTTYHFTWKIRLNGLLVDGGKQIIDLPPGASQYVYLVQPNTPPPTDLPKPGFLTAGTLKDEIIKGDLILQPVSAGDAMAQSLLPTALPVLFRFSYWSNNWQQFWNISCIFLLLVVGGMFSIWVHAGMPNTARALILRRRIDDLETKIHGLGASINSRWRVLLESHLPALRRELVSTFWIFPSFASTLDGLTKKVDMIQQWVEVAYSASVVLHEADQSMQLIPPTVLLWLRERCARSLTPIQSGLTTDKEIEDMKAGLDAAENYLKITVARTQNADLDKVITDRENRLQPPELCRLAKDYPQCAGLVKQVQNTMTNHTPPSPVNYNDRDVLSLKVDLLWTFDQRIQQIGDTEARERIKNYEGELMKYLVADTHESLRMARLIVAQMCQDLYPEALKGPVTETPLAVAITTDPTTVHVQSPVRLALRFKRQLLNEAVARQAWTCTWDFGDHTPSEDGWEVFHSYELPGPQHVQVTIYDLDGKPVSSDLVSRDVTVGDDPQRSVSTRSVQPTSKTTWPEYMRRMLARVLRLVTLAPETRLELIRLLIVLTLALLGLMTSAQQQAQNLSFLEAVGAVVALGLGVDTIKNLIVQGSPSS